MTQTLKCDFEVHATVNDGILYVLCRTASKKASGRTIKVEVYHRWQIEPDGTLTQLDDEERLRDELLISPTS